MYSSYNPGSVSRTIDPLKKGDAQAMTMLWNYFFEPLVERVRKRLQGGRGGVLGAEDVVQEAMLQFCEKMKKPNVDQRFPNLKNRSNLWKLLVCFAIRRASSEERKNNRQNQIVGGESKLGDFGFEPFTGRDVSPDYPIAVVDLLDCLKRKELRTLASLKMEGYTNAQSAQIMGVSEATVERRLSVIRSLLRSQLQEEMR